MKKIIGILFIVLPSILSAQLEANSWINYSQSYHKFKVAQDGVYRIPYQTLVNSTIPLSNIDPRNFQLFSRGKEVPIYIKGEADGTFNATDYIEFYAEGNDGWLDTVLYKSRDKQPNPYVSLINDTIGYYLSWNNSTNNLRFQEENAIDFSNYFKASFIWKEQLESFRGSSSTFAMNYFRGKSILGGGTDPEYVETEGFMNSALSLGNSRNIIFPTPNRYTSGPFLDFEFQLTGQSDYRPLPNGDHHFRLSIGNQEFDQVFEGYQLLKFQRSFSPTEIIGGNNTIRTVSIDDLGSEADRTALAYIKMTYPHTMSLSNASYFEFLLDDANNQNAQYLELLFFRGGSNPRLYDLTNRKKVRILETLSNYRTIIPNGQGRKRCVVLSEDEVIPIRQLTPVEGSGTFTDYSAQITDSTFVIISTNELATGASDYATYRQSQGKNSRVFDIDKLFDQYGYGIPKNPLAIRNFIDDALSSWPFPPTHLFLIGKSIDLVNSRTSLSAYRENLVPTIGNPSTDNLLIAGLNGTNLEPPIPVGRLSAKSNSEIRNYLNKVIEYEAAPPAKWMKEALHFAGGKTAFETNSHENYLNGFAQDFQSDPLGGNSRLFRKSTTAPFQISLSDSIRTLINNGVSILTFFGHSTGNGEFDISIDTPDKLRNKGKYHVLLANSCFAGNTHQSGIESTSELYVLQKDAGAVAFIANGNLGLPSFLNLYSSAFYENFANKNYGKSLAENMRLAVKDIQTASVADPLKSVCLEMTLQGDPSLVLNFHEAPDYFTKEEYVEVIPNDVTTDLDSFKVRILVDNIGRAVNDSVVLRMRRSFPLASANDTIISKKVSPIDYENYVEFTFPVDLLRGVGMNDFSFSIDPLDQIQELSELNNVVNFEVLVRSGEIIPTHPYRYSVVGNQGVTLKASTAFAFEEEKSYLFEIDTSLAFNSLLKPSFNIQSPGGVVEWTPSVLQNMPDSAVYYWRVSKVPEVGGDFNWRTSSFQYIAGESGWAQDHFDQFTRNNYLFVNQNQANYQFTFADNIREVTVRNVGTPANQQELNSIYYSIDADIRERGSCFTTPAFLIAILDSLTLEAWETPYNGLNLQNDFGQANRFTNWCFPNRQRPEAVFNFQVTDANQMIGMRDMLNNSVPDNNYILVYTWFPVNYDAIDNIDPSILQSIANLGGTQIQSAPNGYPYIFTVKKGDLSTVREVVGDSASDKIEIVQNIRTTANFGQSTSTVIGPSNDFKKLSYRFTSNEANSDDSVMVDLIGIDNLGREQTLFSSTKKVLDTIASPLIDGKRFKQLKLKYRATDNTLRTIPQLNRWQMSYVELPDAALSPNVFFEINKDTLQQGEPLQLKIAIQNLSSTDMDSLRIAYQVLNSQNKLTNISMPTIAPLKGDSTIITSVEIPTNAFFGKNTLSIEVNPDQEQLEQNTFNNVGQFDFFVTNDNLNPLLEVTFDGRHILNGEIVSAEPIINISLRDDNRFLALDDTSSFAVFLTVPGESEQLLNYSLNSNYQLQFLPANLPENKATVRFQPLLAKDGTHQLRIQAADKSGNASGEQDYVVQFEVVNKSTVTHLLNYPNPFSTSTRFVFTLTGSRVPDQIQIQIMTITGKVVREIDQFELGNIHIGNNITDYAWDGKDEFGDQLANGVYLYRVKMRINGRNIERRETKADQFFTKDFGKMFLLR